MTQLALTSEEQRWLSGDAGPVRKLAMEVTVATADAVGATELVPVEFAHINSCFWVGQISVDFAEFLVANNASFAVPTHLNASVIDRGAVHRSEALFPEESKGAGRLMEIYEALGANPMWTCAPYHEPEGRPPFGQQIIGSESNAVSFFNSVLGARTNKYGDFLDVCGALIGKVPLAGLHTDEGRFATHLFSVELESAVLTDPRIAHVLGIILGANCGSAIPVLDGLPESTTEEDLKAIAAAGATSGAVEMFHAVGVTPEAQTLSDALGGRTPAKRTVIDNALVQATLDALSTASSEPVDTICLGAPHFSVEGFAELHGALDGRRLAPGVRCLVTTSRAVFQEVQLRGWTGSLEEAGVEVILDTCSYFTPKMPQLGRHVITNSAKWAYYAPGMLGLDVTFSNIEGCVEAGVAGVSR